MLVARGASSPVALPVPRQACLGLARAVLFSASASSPGKHGDAGGVAARMRQCTSVDPSVAAWLSAADVDGPACVRRLAETLVLVDDMHAGRADGMRCVEMAAWERIVSLGRLDAPREWLEAADAVAIDAAAPGAWAPPAEEAWLLRDAVRAAVAVLVEGERFEAAVAEARLAAMRELAYGAGHEINNPLANIATRAQSLLIEETDPERRRRLATIVDQAFRARDMIGGLMLFARPPKPQPADADVGTVVTAVVESTQPLAAARAARLEYSPPPSPVAARIDRPQVEEAVRAIVVNAIEAVEPGGRVVVSVRIPQAAAGALAEGPAACEVVVSDDGHGMDEPTMQRAFDPFFSGREAGRGAGLGLSKAWRLIGINGGGVKLDSRVGQGTRVTVTLPRR